jgi:hypothetical protein
VSAVGADTAAAAAAAPSSERSSSKSVEGRKGGFYLLRCDLPFPGGMGSSQSIGPWKTESVASMGVEALVISIESISFAQQAGYGPPPLLRAVPSNSYERSLQEDNCGVRASVSHVRVCKKAIGNLKISSLESNAASEATNAEATNALIDRGDAPPLPPGTWKVPEAITYGAPQLNLMSALRKQGGKATTIDQTNSKRAPSLSPSVSGSIVVAAMRFCYPSSSPKGKLLVVLRPTASLPKCGGGSSGLKGASLSLVVVDVATLNSESGEALSSEIKTQGEALLSDALAKCNSTSGGWLGTASEVVAGQATQDLNRKHQVLLRVEPLGGHLELLTRRLPSATTEAPSSSSSSSFSSTSLVVMESFKVWQNIQTPEPVTALALDHLSGGFATSSTVESGAVVAFWSFSHNRVPARLVDFLGL